MLFALVEEAGANLSTLLVRLDENEVQLYVATLDTQQEVFSFSLPTEVFELFVRKGDDNAEEA